MTVYVAPLGFEKELVNELTRNHLAGTGSAIRFVQSRLVVTEGPRQDVAWAQNVWLDPREIQIESIGDAAKKLRELKPLWSLHSNSHHRRASLVQAKLPKVRDVQLTFLGPLPDRELGSWTMLAPDRILASPSCTSRFPDGDVRFIEDKTSAPSRAYLKLWELFTVDGIRPKPGDRCLDLGSCPGGWTWVLAKMGCDVVSVDKAPLDPRVAKLENVRQLNRDAFKLKPDDVGTVDWLFSDIICYPADLLALVTRFRDSGLVKNFVCTIKYKGETDFESTQAFAQWPGAKIRHLAHNKHEVTWWFLGSDRAGGSTL